jgi:hypothetical protein
MKKSELRQIIKEEYEKITNTQVAEERKVYKTAEFEEIDSASATILNNVYVFPEEVSARIVELMEELDSYIERYGFMSIDEASKEEVENQKELNKELEKTTNIKKQMSSLNEEDDDDDSPTDKEPTAKDLKNDSVAVLASKLKKIEAEMKSTVKKWKTSEGAEKAKLTQRLKELTTQKKEIEKFL